MVAEYRRKLKELLAGLPLYVLNASNRLGWLYQLWHSVTKERVNRSEAKIDCWVPSLPLSREVEREQKLRRDRGLYRLAFGQPRQEDLTNVLTGSEADGSLRIDLSPTGGRE